MLGVTDNTDRYWYQPQLTSLKQVTFALAYKSICTGLDFFKLPT